MKKLIEATPFGSVYRLLKYQWHYVLAALFLIGLVYCCVMFAYYSLYILLIIHCIFCYYYINNYLYPRFISYS